MPDYDKLAAQFGGSTDPGQAPDKYDLAAQKFGGVAGAAPTKKAAPDWSDVPLQAVKNLLPSAGNLIGGIWHAVSHPIDTAGDALDVGAGALRNVLPASVSSAIDRLDPGQNAAANQQRISSYADAAGKFIKDRYGSGDALKTTLATDPVGAALDLSTVLTGGGSLATKVPALAKAGEAAKVIGNAVNPINATTSAVSRAAPAAVRALVDQQQMAQRLADLKAGGIDNPSLGLATGSKFVSGLENLLSQTPGAMGLYERAQAANVAGMRAKAEGIRDAISPEYGPVVAGEAIQGDLKGSFRNRVNTTTRMLNDRVADNVGPDFYTYPENALDTARGMSAINPAAPATSQALQNRRIAGIADDLSSDVLGTPIPGDPLMNAPTRYQRADGQVMDTPPGIPFATLKNLRTSIGEEANSPAILGTPEGAQFKRLYGAMSQDMREGVGAADRQNAGVDIGPLLPSQQPATMALNRANTFYSRAATRAEDLNGIANRDTPEGAYGAVASSLKSGPTVYERLRGAITPEARQKVVASVVNDMGYAAPGLQNADGSVWSARSFLTNYNRLDPDARGALFTRLPGGQLYADNLAKVAKAAEMMGDSAKVWANPSGTSHALAARGAIGTIGLGVVGGLFYKPLLAPAAAAGGTMLAAHQVSQRLLLNPKFVNWLAKSTTVPPAQVPAYAQRLLANARLSGDKQFQQDAADYLSALQDGSP